MTVDPKRVLVVEDHQLFRGLITHLCEQQNEVTVVAEAGDGKQALELASVEKPDLVILDLKLPDTDGFTVAEELAAALPGVRILAVSGYLTPYIVKLAEDAPIHGLLDKVSEPVENLLKAIHQVAGRQEYFSPCFLEIRNELRANGNSFAKILSRREQDLMCYLGRGDSNQAIARQLEISPKTVQTHRHNIMKKLGIRDTPTLMNFARMQGFTVFDSPK